MELLEKTLNKKVAIFAGAMVLTLAMGTAAYAGVAGNSDGQKIKPNEPIPATQCKEAVHATLSRDDVETDWSIVGDGETIEATIIDISAESIETDKSEK